MLSPMEKTSLNPSTLLAPVPVVLVSCRGTAGGECDKDNLITLAWAGVVCSDPPMVSISIRESRYSHRQISESGEFVINLVHNDLAQGDRLLRCQIGQGSRQIQRMQTDASTRSGTADSTSSGRKSADAVLQVRQVIPLAHTTALLPKSLLLKPPAA